MRTSLGDSPPWSALAHARGDKPDAVASKLQPACDYLTSRALSVAWQPASLGFLLHSAFLMASAWTARVLIWLFTTKVGSNSDVAVQRVCARAHEQLRALDALDALGALGDRDRVEACRVAGAELPVSARRSGCATVEVLEKTQLRFVELLHAALPARFDVALRRTGADAAPTIRSCISGDLGASAAAHESPKPESVVAQRCSLLISASGFE